MADNDWDFAAAPASLALNQPGDLVGYNPYQGDQALIGAIGSFGGGAGQERLTAFGSSIGTAHMLNLARLANQNPPRLERFDRFGNRVDQVAFHPAWHSLMQLARGALIHALPWRRPAPGAHVVRAGLAYLLNQGENGVCCPTTMSFASHGVLSQAPGVFAAYSPKILSPRYDPRPLPAAEKTALTVGMAMTERQGGSDLRETQTTAQPIAGSDYWRLNGHKWFFSVPQSDLFLTLARTQKGLSCFLAEGRRAGGQRNGVLVQRLKDKCGNRSNATAEVEFVDLPALMIGEDGRGIPTVIGMAHLTRFDCALSSAAIMRQALTQAIHHCTHRRAFGQQLVDQPLMRNVLADLALDAESFMWAGMRLAHSLDRTDTESERLLGRITIPMMKYQAGKHAPAFIAEALECHGGNGYIEDHLMARLYREAPLNGIWEGSGNIICLDVLRAIASSPDMPQVWHDELAGSRGVSPAFDRRLDRVMGWLRDVNDAAMAARRIVEEMALLFRAHLLIRHAPTEVSETFCAARLGDHSARYYGSLPDNAPTRFLIERATMTPAT